MSERVRVRYTGGGSGLGCTTAMFILFLGLKLGKVGVVAAWPWWAVAAPLWAPWAAAVVVLAAIAFVTVVTGILNWAGEAWRRRRDEREAEK